MSNAVSAAVTGLVLCCLHAVSHADWWGGVDLGYYHWNPSLTGTVGTSAIDTNDELNLDNQSHGVAWLAVEHFDVFYPNIRFEATSIALDGSGTIPTQKTLRRAAFDGPVTAELEYDQYDLTAYYQLYDNFWTLDAGITARLFEGFMLIRRTDGLLSERANFSNIAPLVFAKLHGDLPLKGWYADTLFNGITFDRTTLTDITAKIGWKHEFERLNYSHIGLELGYRHQKIALHEIDDFDTDFRLDGGFVGLNLRLGF